MQARKIDPEQILQEKCAEYYSRPYDFVMWVFPWGEPGTILEHETGPDKWQTKVLKALQEAIQTGKISFDGMTRIIEAAIQLAVRSGHGVGKTALIGWIIHWFMSTRPFPQVVATANTKEQLLNKTWRELAKWHKLSINRHWFKRSATKYVFLPEQDTWFASAVPWSKERSESFAGTHEKHVLMLFDEASAIDDIIWEVAEGAMTTPGAIWIAFGNPTRNTGRFSECFKKFRHRWLTYEVDSRTAKKADQKKLQQWIDDYGEDSDFVRVRVKGQEPRAGLKQFIPGDLVESALGKVIHPSIYRRSARILAVDVARFGDDQSCMIKRQGLAAFGLKKYRGIDTMHLASLVAKEINDWKPDAVFVDEVGIGAGVVDRLRQLGYEVIGVNPGLEANKKDIYFNKRVEMWGDLRDWLKAGGAIPDDNELRDDLVGPEYGFSVKEQFQLEKKQDMKERGLASPDCGDVLAYTFYMPIIAGDDLRLGGELYDLNHPEPYDPSSHRLRMTDR